MFGLMGVARMSGQPGGAFSPASLFANSEQGAWYDPSDFSSMFQDSAGTTPVTAVEQPVGYIADKSGNGNHATQATAAARPVVSARVNLLTKTEDISNASWVKTFCTATSDVSDPLGGTSAFTITATSADGRLARSDSEVTTTSGVTYTISAYIRRRTGTGDVQVYCQSAAGYFSPTLALTTEWQRFTWTFTSTSTLADIRLLHIYTSGDAIDVWHPQLEIASTATRYQRVTTATDYDTVGFPYYTSNDGIDDLLSPTFPDLGTDVTIARAVPMVGASILTGQTIGAGTWTDSTNHAGLVIIDRALTAGETAALTAYLDAKAGV